MRILNSEQFIKEPYGVVYCECIDSMFTDQIAIKYEQRGNDHRSWWMLQVAPWLATEYDSLGAHPFGEEIETEDFCTDDAVYNHDSKTRYAVFSREEVEKMIERLQEALKMTGGTE